MNSASNFPGSARVHISLNVANLDRSIEFYQMLFGVAPSKTKPDYAKFEPAEPSINLALNAGRDAADQESRVSHFGIQVKSTDAVKAATARLNDAGQGITPEDGVTCCYAVQDKVWVTDPDGNAWEIFVVTEANTDVHTEGRAGPEFVCCPTETTTTTCC